MGACRSGPVGGLYPAYRDKPTRAAQLAAMRNRGGLT
jgi:hypothetical protein